MAADPTTQARPGRDELSALVRAAYRAAYGERATVLDGDVTVLRAPEAPGSPFLNRVLGLGAAGQDDERPLDAALAELAGSAVYVAVEPGAAAAGLERLLRARRFEPGWGWMRFERGVEPSRPAPTSLRLVEVGPSEAAAFARVVACGYDLPAAILPWLARVPPIRLAGVARARGRRAGRGGGALPERTRRLSRLRRDPAGVPRAGSAGRAPGRPDRARPRPRLHVARDRDGGAAAGPAGALLPEHPASGLRRDDGGRELGRDGYGGA